MSTYLQPGTNYSVAVGGNPVVAIPAGANGGIILNPFTATDQSVALAEPLYVNPLGLATVIGNGSTFVLQPGQSWTIIPGQATATTVTAATGGHTFSVVWW